MSCLVLQAGVETAVCFMTNLTFDSHSYLLVESLDFRFLSCCCSWLRSVGLLLERNDGVLHDLGNTVCGAVP